MDERDYESGRRRGPIVAGHPGRDSVSARKAEVMAKLVTATTCRVMAANTVPVTGSTRAMAIAVPQAATMPAMPPAAFIPSTTRLSAVLQSLSLSLSALLPRQ